MSSNKISHGIITDDPAKTLPIGSKLCLEPFLVEYSPPVNSSWVSNWESLNGVVLAITFTNGQADRIEGSAVIVAPGIALCSAHVIQPKIDALMSSLEEVICFGLTSKGTQIWRIRKVTIVTDSDIAILGLELSSDISPEDTIHQTVITTRLPKIGERVTIFGFRAGELEFPRVGNEVPTFSFNLLVCAGEVVERYVSRDRVMMPWPTLEVSCPTWGGMSGGPVFDSNGKILGLLSSSFTTDSGDGPSYVSLLIPCLSTQFEGGWPGPLFRGKQSLLELDPRICHIDKREAYSITRHPDTGQTTISYRVWE